MEYERKGGRRAGKEQVKVSLKEERRKVVIRLDQNTGYGRKGGKVAEG